MKDEYHYPVVEHRCKKCGRFIEFRHGRWYHIEEDNDG